jgi:hypothetical protein
MNRDFVRFSIKGYSRIIVSIRSATEVVLASALLLLSVVVPAQAQSANPFGTPSESVPAPRRSG